MDNILIIYLLKVSIALSMFYLLYMLCLRGDTFLKIRRFFFLFAALFSVVFPFVKIEIPVGKEAPVQIPSYWLSDLEAGAVIAQPLQDSQINITGIIILILGAISLVFIFRFLIQLFSIVRLRMNNETEDFSTCRIIRINDNETSPFSFFRWIFINTANSSNDKLEEVLAHEQVHVSQYHSVDVMLYELLCICFWWNPFAWLLKREMKINLEYLADEGVLRAGFDSKEYQYILLKATNKNTGIPLINNFNVSQLKKRIAMMNKKETYIVKAAKYLLAVPLGLSLLFGNAVQASSTSLIETIEEVTQDVKQNPKKKEGVFNTVEVMPIFPGGEKAMHKFISDNLKYPVKAVEGKVQGRVVVRFIVSKEGNITDTEVVRSLSAETDAEALRVMKMMPKWTPGKQNGAAVDVYFTLPIVFSLQKNTGSPTKKQEVATLPGSKQDDKNKTFVTVEQMPMFPGGESAMQKFVADNLKYPVKAIEQKIEGRVVIRFIVGADGSISEAKIIRGILPEADAEALRVINAMPKWTPGKQGGKDVPVYFTIPIVFRIPKDTPDKEKV